MKRLMLIVLVVAPACARLHSREPLPVPAADVTTYHVDALGFAPVDNTSPKQTVYDQLIEVWNGDPAASFVETQQRLSNGEAHRFTTTAEKASDVAAAVFRSEAGARAAFVAMALLPGTPALSGAASASAFHERVIEVATSHPAFTGGELQPLVTDAPADVIAYTRGDVVVLVNTRPRDINVAVHGRMLHRARDLIHGWVQSGETVMLSAFGTAVLDVRYR
ncbi:MAG TPA: hypothetical protein VFZ04_12655 [Longimicrobiales bacterium]